MNARAICQLTALALQVRTCAARACADEHAPMTPTAAMAMFLCRRSVEGFLKEKRRSQGVLLKEILSLAMTISVERVFIKCAYNMPFVKHRHGVDDTRVVRHHLFFICNLQQLTILRGHLFVVATAHGCVVLAQTCEQ